MAITLNGTTGITDADGGTVLNTNDLPLISGYREIVSAGTTTILTSSDAQIIYVSGTLAHTIVLPDVTTLTLGRVFIITNGSSNTSGLIVQSSGLNNITPNISNGHTARYTCIAITGTGVASWAIQVSGATTRSGSGSMVFNSSPNLGGNVTMTGAITEAVYAVTGTTPDLSATNGTIQTWTLTGASTPTSSLTTGQSITLMIDDGTAYTITWPSVTWVNNAAAAPTLATTGYTVVVLWNTSGTLYGALVGNRT